MPVCLTGDVHHQSLRTADQAALECKEPHVAVEYAKIIEEYNLNATLFVTGRTIDEDPRCVQQMSQVKGIEIGGHNYGAFTIPKLPYSGKLFTGYRQVTGNNGPRWFQSRGIRKTIRRLENATSQEVVSWRDHAFNRDEHTYDLLTAAGIQYVSDERSPTRERPYTVQTSNGPITEVPINVPPDHDHIKHGTFVPPNGWSDPFSGDVYSGRKWLNQVQDTIEQIDAQDGLITILAHPACMSLIDNFDLFERLCDMLSKYETVSTREVGTIFPSNERT
jgi:peptidoglycan/xylan/chitin deacetylase (PgdA/CDA1 family)